MEKSFQRSWPSRGTSSRKQGKPRMSIGKYMPGRRRGGSHDACLRFPIGPSVPPSRYPLARRISWRIKTALKGRWNQAKGKAKEVAGKATGDTKTESEGKADQVKGKVQNTVGGMKDKVRE